MTPNTITEDLLLVPATKIRDLADAGKFLELFKAPQSANRLTNKLIFVAAAHLEFTDHLAFFQSVEADGHKITSQNWGRLVAKGDISEVRRLARKAPSLRVGQIAWLTLINKSPRSETRRLFDRMNVARIRPNHEIYTACVVRSDDFEAAFYFLRQAGRNLDFLGRALIEGIMRHCRSKKELARVVGFIEKEEIYIDETAREGIESIMTNSFSERTAAATIERITPFFIVHSDD